MGPAHRIPDVSASGGSGPGYPQGGQRALADVSRGDMESHTGLNISMLHISISDTMPQYKGKVVLLCESYLVRET